MDIFFSACHAAHPISLSVMNIFTLASGSQRGPKHDSLTHVNKIIYVRLSDLSDDQAAINSCSFPGTDVLTVTRDSWMTQNERKTTLIKMSSLILHSLVLLSGNSANECILSLSVFCFFFKCDEWNLAARRQSNLKLHPPPALSLPTLNHLCGVHGDAVAALPLCQTRYSAFCLPSSTHCFILVFTKTVDSVEAEFFIREAKVSDSWLGSSTARTGVDYGVPNAAILKPACFTAVQELKLPRCIKLTHFGRHWTVSNARLNRLRIVHLLEALEEIHFA